ncbi:MAG: MBL fold metallo-hydrolase [Firmicutes bacterium]|nr:MBL fold metallo-hydrolase [Bacillota bacterium]
MDNNSAIITHLFHSGFLVETKSSILIFDYSPDYDINPYLEITPDYLDNGKNVFVFVSHSHSDHFDPTIFDWQKSSTSIKYILSNDIVINKPRNNYYSMDKYKTFKLDNVTIHSLGSTDKGLSFLVNVDDLNIFHAGDLNWWHWKNDSLESQLEEERNFKDEIQRLKKLNYKAIDIAFFPVDPRLEEFYYFGGKYFAEIIKPKMLFPMHFGDKFHVCKDFKKKIRHLDVKVPNIAENKRKFTYNS